MSNVQRLKSYQADPITKTSDLPLFEDQRFKVTCSDLRTVNTYYPIDETIGRIRKDILFASLAFSVLIGFALWRYLDLWRFNEMIIMGGAIVLALLIGSQMSILQIDARGFPSRMYFGRTKTIKSVFNAITIAKAKARNKELSLDLNE